MKPPFLESLRLDGFLSFAPGTPAIELRALNVLIGPNGAGKSNLIEGVEILKAAPSGFGAALRLGGGPEWWIWRDGSTRTAQIEAIISRVAPQRSMRYRLAFAASGTNVSIEAEDLEALPDSSGAQPQTFLRYARAETIKAFLGGIKTGRDTFSVLLVDSDEAVTKTPIEHLRLRGPTKALIDADAVHLMVRTMETWIVADPASLMTLYGKGFKPSALPKTKNLETVDKRRIADGLETATKNTSRGTYHKINHIRDVLSALDPAKVRSRCSHCERLFSTLESRLGRS